MEIIRNTKELKDVLRPLERAGKKIGFVPTMGYLHDGHLSLLKQSRVENDISVLSIFVNPTQFGANEDLSSYPRNEQRDLELASESGVDYVFIPDTEEMYKDSLTTVSLSEITSELCGKSRPTHFNGVATVVTKLFNIVRPTNAYFGEKDIQQLIVIKKMVFDLDMDVNVIGCPIVREEDGLALSSRNVYLSQSEREDALSLSRALSLVKENYSKGERNALELKRLMIEEIEKHESAKIDYAEIVDYNRLKQVENITSKSIALLAVYIGNTRLIDNLILEEKKC